MLQTVAVEGYRSLRSLVVPLAQLTVVTGANGSGKSNLYRVLRLLAATADGGAVRALAAEGGIASVLWAGPERAADDEDLSGSVRTRPVAVRIGLGGDDLGYAVDFGLPVPDSTSMFQRDPEIKEEVVWAGPVLRPAALLSRRAGSAVMTREDGRWLDTGRRLARQDSLLAEVSDIESAPEVLRVRNRVRGWRFYDSFRTDAGAPARRAQPGTFTPVVADDGADLASALQTLRELGHAEELDAAVAGAFPGSRLEVVDQDGLFRVRLRQSGLLRPLDAAELSDGTLRFLLWTAALLTPRPPELFVLNEPETSLHPDLLPPLAEMVASAAVRAQVVVVTHSAALRGLLAAATEGADVADLHLVKENGETRVDGQGMLDRPLWRWPSR
ncbi:AAA family ATPase [Blastococcus sp. TML/M2B]|uniref:AAA family ATPase n=1 Tax=unclassified Blastococcus TaxID=2619396 RepID=UPI00190C55AE|nr:MULTISPECIES: AAA family ATPase [unclassified Blastococcus]MBN1093414.1 AAA family ATPase [Blastococcus sp. TML/M2B]MBN1096466.1 AAA family ATPase [Blastococcus sp. TML/C7B]